MSTPHPLRVTVECEAVRRRGPTSWLVTWRIHNATPTTVTVVEAWHPHRRFRSSRLRRSLRLPPRGSASLDVPARVDVGPWEVVENCFLILRATRGRERWRVTVRSTLRLDRDGAPRPAVEAVDAYPAAR